MAEEEGGFSPQTVINYLKANNVTHVVWLPDSETNFLYTLMTQEPSLELVTISREGQAFSTAAGLSVGGAKPVILIQNTGIKLSDHCFKSDNRDFRLKSVFQSLRQVSLFTKRYTRTEFTSNTVHGRCCGIQNPSVLTDAPSQMPKVLSLFLPNFGIHQPASRVRGISVPACERS